MSPTGLQIQAQKWDHTQLRIWVWSHLQWNEVKETPLRTAEVWQQNANPREAAIPSSKDEIPCLIYFLLYFECFISDFYISFPLPSSLKNCSQADLLTRLPQKSHPPYPEWSWTRNLPLDAPISPVNILKMVVFPAPFTPSKPKHWVVGKKGRNVTMLYL